MKKLYLASSSQSRQQLLRDAGFSFSLISQNSTEQYPASIQDLASILRYIAQDKMNHVMMPQGQEGEEVIVVTADTLGLNHEGRICGKPSSYEDAVLMIQSYRHGAITGTGFCVALKKYQDGTWHTVQEIIGYAQASYIFNVPDRDIPWYLEKLPIVYTALSGAVSIEGIGAQFLVSLDGSYTAVLGLPMYELRQAIDALESMRITF